MTSLLIGITAALAVAGALWPDITPRRPHAAVDTAPDRLSWLPLWAGGATGAVLVSIVIGLVPTVALFGAAVGARWWRGRVIHAARQRLIDDALPEVIDLLAVVFGAGGTASQCLAVLADRGPLATRPGVAVARRQQAVGTSLVACLESLVDELGPAYRPAVRVLVATERDGAPVATLLERLADESRSARRRQMEARARRLPVLLLGPLVVCFLPAVVVGTIVPLVVVSLQRLTG